MDKLDFLLVLAGFFIFVLIGLVVFNDENIFNSATGEVTLDYYTYTKAFCNSTNYCEDYEITCQNGELANMEFTGFAVQNPSNWNDPRSEEEIEKLC